jgi:alanine racemase
MDTGMAREGCPEHEWDALIAKAREGQRQGKVRIAGLMGHLPLADQANPEANALAVSRMRQASEAVTAGGLDIPLIHLAATSGTLTDPATHFGMVRFGAGLVGIDPSGTTEMHDASRLTAPVVHSAAVRAGTPLGYGGGYVTDRSTNLSVLPLGYADGIPREISREAAVEIHSRRYALVGRVSMDQIIIDTGAEQIPLGTTATVFGPQESTGVTPTIRDWAGWAGTIPHTIVTGIGSRVRRTIA